MVTINQIYNANFAGRIAETSEIWNLRVFSNVWNFGSVTADGYDNQQLYTLTGWHIARNGNDFYQTTTGQYIKLSTSTITDQYDRADANGQDLVNKIIANNKKILENNLICARFAHRLNVDQRYMLFDLQSRLNLRNEALLNNQLISSASTASPQGYALLANYLDEFMANGKVGIVVSQTAIIVVSAVVLASVSASAYFAYKAYYNESMDDIKYSNELTNTLLSKLTDEEYAQLKAETAGIVTKARLKSSFGSAYTVVKVALFALLGYMAYSYIQPKIVTLKNKTNDKVRRTS